MSAFVILAAGRGSRIGRAGDRLNKSLVPLGGSSPLSRLLDLAPDDARVIICVGYREDQVRRYVRLAHPNRGDVTFVSVKDWDEPGAGPGASLYAARDVIDDDDLILTTCDTLWDPDPEIWSGADSWVGVAPVPAGTPPERWCRVHVDDAGDIDYIWDKQPGFEHKNTYAYVGLARITRHDLPMFWDGVERGPLVQNELQVTGGLSRLVDAGRLRTRRINWTDVGDEDAYRAAVALISGYDWTKLDEATYVLPSESRVVKFWSDPNVAAQRYVRGTDLHPCVPPMIDATDDMLAYEYVPGVTGYRALETREGSLFLSLLNWARDELWLRRDDVEQIERREACTLFYDVKTYERIAKLQPDLRRRCEDVLHDVAWNEVMHGCEPGRIHGDFNLGNVIVTPDDRFIGIDWRQDFAGHTDWGDIRYDVAKLLAGCYVHWDNARRGDFRPWQDGEGYAAWIRDAWPDRIDIETIAALSLLNSAPLHAPPLDEILVSRGVSWLEALR